MEMLTQPAHLDADDRIGFGIKRISPAERGRAKDVLLQLIAAALQCLVNGETQQVPKTIGALEHTAAQHLLEVRLYDRPEELKSGCARCVWIRNRHSVRPIVCQRKWMRDS